MKVYVANTPAGPYTLFSTCAESESATPVLASVCNSPIGAIISGYCNNDTTASARLVLITEYTPEISFDSVYTYIRGK